ncbi:hypothetical protein [Cupriavidus necator]
MRREQFVEYIEQAVLKALDTAVLDLSGQDRSGWTDNELLALLPAIHHQAKAMYRRLTVHEPEQPAPEPPYGGELFGADPNCNHDVQCAPGGGVKCPGVVLLLNAATLP